ncbi:MAG: hypothetical protein GXY83_02955 [Rhodopirellula sp.]|nr:hypothetical protein [Rhodopirellula sp.]
MRPKKSIIRVTTDGNSAWFHASPSGDEIVLRRIPDFAERSWTAEDRRKKTDLDTDEANGTAEQFLLSEVRRWTGMPVPFSVQQPEAWAVVVHRLKAALVKSRDSDSFTGEKLKKWLATNHVNGAISADSDYQLSISSYLIRCRCANECLAAIGGERSEKEQINGFLDALHWYDTQGEASKLTYYIGKGNHTNTVLQALGTLREALEEKYRKCVTVCSTNGSEEVAPMPPPEFAVEKWADRLRERHAISPPPLAEKLKKKVDRNSFRWYRSLTGAAWSGRVEGLEVCQIGDKACGCIAIGKRGETQSDSDATGRFRELTGYDSFDFDEKNLEEAAKIVRVLDDDRQFGELALVETEHFLESRVLRGRVKISLSDGTMLKPLLETEDYPFQFPAQWSANGRAKFIDVLMTSGKTLYVVELKVASGGQGQYYRHAIAQAVLYRYFLQKANALKDWLTQKACFSIDANAIRAAIAFPRLRGTKKYTEDLQGSLNSLAGHFGVEVTELSEDWDTPGVS